MLLRAGAKATATDADGECALHKAASRGMAQTTSVLYAACPAAAELRDRKGLTPAERTTDDATLEALGRRS